MLTVFIILYTTILYSVGHSLSASRTDLYGTYYYDSRGYKIYSSCRNRQTYTQHQCRSYSLGRYDYDRYNRDHYSSYERDGDYYNNLRGKVNVGDGSYRIINGGRDAELTCEFPLGSSIISNIVWTRVHDRDYYRDRYNSLSHWFGRRMRVEKIGNYGSALTIRDYEERDGGIYRCEATRSYDSYRGSYGYRGSYDRSEEIYMEVEFRPRNSLLGGYRGDDYYSGRTAGVKTEEDTVVKENGWIEENGAK